MSSGGARPAFNRPSSGPRPAGAGQFQRPGQPRTGAPK